MDQPFYTDPTFLTVVAIVLAIAIPAVVYAMQRRPKHLDYKVLRASPVANTKLLRSGRIEVRHGDESMTAPHTLTVRIGNNGRVPILKGDYEGSVVVNAGDAVVYEAWLADRQPPDVDVSIEQSRDMHGELTGAFSVNPGLLNPNDWFDVDALVEGKPEVTVSARIAGVDEVRDAANVGPLGWKVFNVGVVVGLVALILAFLWIAVSDALQGNYEAVVAFASLVIGGPLLLWLLIFINERSEKRNKHKPFS